jgi:hypothetical protein
MKEVADKGELVRLKCNMIIKGKLVRTGSVLKRSEIPEQLRKRRFVEDHSIGQNGFELCNTRLGQNDFVLHK